MSSPSERAHDPITAWAEDAVGGKIVVGELVAASAERHLRDLKDGPARGLYWSIDAATRPLRFLPAMLTITEGAKVGEEKPLASRGGKCKKDWEAVNFSAEKVLHLL